MHGCLLLDADRRDQEAVLYLARAVAIEPENPGVCGRCRPRGTRSTGPTRRSHWRCGRRRWRPATRADALHAAELLLRGGGSTRRWRCSIAPARAVRRCDAAARACFRGEAASAPPARGARGDRPGVGGDRRHIAEYHLHRGHLLYRLGEFARPPRRSIGAPALDPDSHAARRAQLDLYFADGRLSEATPPAASCLRASPMTRRRRGGAAGAQSPARHDRRRLCRARRPRRRGRAAPALCAPGFVGRH